MGKEEGKTIQGINQDLLEAMLNNIFVGIHIINKEGIIVFRNRKLEELSGIKTKNVLNKHASVTEKNDLLEVLRTGIPQFGINYKSKTGENSLVNRIPLILNNSIVGAMAIGFLEENIIPSKYNLMEQKLEYYEKELKNLRSAKYDLDNIVGISEKIEYVKGLIVRYGETNSPVLITGDTGTGKELCAHAIHLNSQKKDGPFIKVNCASIPHELFESEFFGYESGAFTGAKKNGKIGKFELANFGTLFLDEISSLPYEMQPKLLRFLQDKEIERVGGNRVVKLDLRVISATNRDLDKMVRDNHFREDLYYRIKVFNLILPPLAQRREDILYLCKHFVNSFNEEYHLKIVDISKEVMDIFHKWPWPGNIRELKNVIETAVMLNHTGVIEAKDLPDYLVRDIKIANKTPKSIDSINYLRVSKNHLEKKLLEETLSESDWNISKTARQLGVSRPQLYALIKKHKLELLRQNLRHWSGLNHSSRI